jgi:hypothetical protein
MHIKLSHGLENRGSIPGRGRFFSSPPRPDRLWGPSSISFNGYGALSPKLKRPGREATTYLHAVPRLECVGLNLHSSALFHGVLLNRQGHLYLFLNFRWPECARHSISVCSTRIRSYAKHWDTRICLTYVCDISVRAKCVSMCGITCQRRMAYIQNASLAQSSEAKCDTLQNLRTNLTGLLSRFEHMDNLKKSFLCLLYKIRTNFENISKRVPLCIQFVLMFIYCENKSTVAKQIPPQIPRCSRSAIMLFLYISLGIHHIEKHLK